MLLEWHWPSNWAGHLKTVSVLLVMRITIVDFSWWGGEWANKKTATTPKDDGRVE
jgi:hypothetical protein